MGLRPAAASSSVLSISVVLTHTSEAWSRKMTGRGAAPRGALDLPDPHLRRRLRPRLSQVRLVSGTDSVESPTRATIPLAGDDDGHDGGRSLHCRGPVSAPAGIWSVTSSASSGSRECCRFDRRLGAASAVMRPAHLFCGASRDWTASFTSCSANSGNQEPETGSILPHSGSKRLRASTEVGQPGWV